MATLPHRVYDRAALFRVSRVVLGVLLIGSAGGCGAQRVFRARDLPPQYLAPARSNIEEIDLSGLANYSVSSETIDLGDVLEVTIVTDYGDQPPLTSPVRIRNDGMADIQSIGPVYVAGLELDEAEQAIAAAGVANSKFNYPPHVTVIMERQCMNKITVIGAVEDPGEYEVPRTRCSMLDAIVAAGALSDSASGDVEIRRRTYRAGQPGSRERNPPLIARHDGTRLTSYVVPEPNQAGGPRVVRINLIKAAAEGDGGPHLEDGDVVMVMKKVPAPIYVRGLVRNPGEFELSPNRDLYMLQSLALAGGCSLPVANKVVVLRRVSGEEPIVIQTTIREAKAGGDANVRLMAGDTVMVEETPATIVMRTITDVLRIGVGSSIPLF